MNTKSLLSGLLGFLLLITGCAPGQQLDQKTSSLGTPIVSHLEKSFLFAGYVYSPQNSNLAVVHKSAPGALLSLLKTGHYISRFDKFEQAVYLANTSGGVLVVDATNPQDLVAGLRFWPSRGHRTVSVKVLHNRLYAVEYDHKIGSWRLKIFNIDDPLNPEELSDTFLGTHASASGGMMVAVDAQHLGVSFINGVEIFDVSDPEAVTRVSTVGVGSPSAMVLLAGRLYLHTGLTMGTSKLTIWDVQNPGNPFKLSQRILIRAAYGQENNMSLGYRNGKLYAFMGGLAGLDIESLIIVDVTDPASPGAPIYLQIRKTNGDAIIVSDVDVEGRTAWIWGWKVPVDFPAGYLYWLVRVDISDADNPTIVDRQQIPKQFPVEQ